MQSIPCEYETKIKRLERQATRYEEYIQYLYKIIEELHVNAEQDKNEIHDLKTRLSELTRQLKHVKKISNEKELFISYRESQLLEFEDVIHCLKERISFLACEKRESNIMSINHTDPLPGEIDITDYNNVGLVEEIRRVVGLMSNSLVNAYKSERSKADARRAEAQIIQVTRLLYTRYNGDLVDGRIKLDDKQDEIDMLQDEYNELIGQYNNLRQISRNIITRQDQDIVRLRRQVAVLRFQNHWRQIRLINHLNIPPQPQAADSVWLLFH